ncbi:hypothetical protein S40285_06453 [Stachybotrys chlorohalonatus IBT 40285]|uniref:Uncharacterized protein n=1 Tax=Stachybotrys chlorohalonatus (strain IBT 40285) TaxID=1283841 RepID=A0A084QB81_STAC4|nr:hypothetical protein S40285_06453 [Stachybotrys chlorohalonata IBT 40285]
MSRALDAKTKEALGHGDHGKVFDDISKALSRSFDDLLEIEFLGRSHAINLDASLLQDENAIAIPKIRLTQAFLVANRLFKRGNWVSDEEALRATGIMLLMDPEHLTAANIRKRVLSKIMLLHQNTEKSLRREKYFIDSLLTSRLHRHTKSPTLWSHRRWLMSQFRRLGFGVDVVDEFKKVILISAERHPRNYYAWCEARSLVNLDSVVWDQMLNESILREVERWCLSHHDDISGWSFLMYMLSGLDQASSTVATTIGLAESFHWRNESVWYFLRNVTTKEKVSASVRSETKRICESLRQGTEENSIERRALDQALDCFSRSDGF